MEEYALLYDSIWRVRRENEEIDQDDIHARDFDTHIKSLLGELSLAMNDSEISVPMKTAHQIRTQVGMLDISFLKLNEHVTIYDQSVSDIYSQIS